VLGHTKGQVLTTVGSSHTHNDHFDIKHLKKLPHQRFMFFIYTFEDALLIIFR